MKKTLLLLIVLISNFNFLSSQTNALQFDGVNDNVLINQNPSIDFGVNSKFSIEAWFNTSSGADCEIFSKMLNSGVYTGYELYSKGGRMSFLFISSWVSNCIWIETVSTFNDGNWHHVACVYDGIPNASNVKIYVDGILQSINITYNNLSGPTNTPTKAGIGARNGNGYFFNGMIDEVRIWNRALCLPEITAKKNCNLVGNEIGLVAYYNFNQGTAAGNNSGLTTLNDLTGVNSGTLTSFALTGGTSNWVNSTASIAGNCAPYGSLAVTGNTVLCSGVTFSTVLTGSGAATYTWSTGPSTPTIAVSPTINTTYTLAGNEAGGCFVSRTVTVTVNPTPTLAATSTSSIICLGQTATLTVTGANTYTWAAGPTSSVMVVSPTVSTIYTVTGTNASGCSSTTFVSQNVSTCLGISVLNIENKTLSIYPNPNSGDFKLKGDENLDLKMANELGQIIYTIQLNESNGREAEIRNLPSGVYFVYGINTSSSIKQKIIVTK